MDHEARRVSPGHKPGICPVEEQGLMVLNTLRHVVSRRPGVVALAWAVLVLTVGFCAPNLTRIAAEGQARMLGNDAESRRAAELVAQSWPDQAYGSMAVVALHRP